MAQLIKIYKIDENTIEKLALHFTKPFIFIFLFLIALQTYFSMKFGTNLSWYLPIGMVALLLFTFPTKKKYIKSMRFELTDKYISQTIDINETDGFIEFSRSFNRGQGNNDEKTILFSEIQSMRINKRGNIIITSTDYNIFTASGKIVIPAEVEDYEELKNALFYSKDKS